MPHLPSKTLFCFGYGYTASVLVAMMKASPRARWSFVGTSRDIEKVRALCDLGIRTFMLDADKGLGDPLGMLAGATHVLITAPPDDEGCPVYRLHAQDILDTPGVEWVGYLSATSVYGNRDGEWVDETSEARPISKRGSRRRLAEEQWMSLHKSDNLPVHLFRLAGIYGPARSGLDSVRAGRARRIKKEGHAFNRIHVNDIAQILLASMSMPRGGAIYNVSDDLPAGSWEVISYACELVGIEPQPIMPFEEADLAPITRSFYADNKRISNALIKSELGVELQFPSFREGLQDCLLSEQRRDQSLEEAGFSVVCDETTGGE